jgi:glycosyltransferase involved in cell wall biosynthesis
MKVSVVVPSLNQGPFLGDALESLINQRDITRNELEIIIMDGGSTDCTVDLLHKYRDAPHVAKIVSGPDGGQADALCRGFAAATGEILGWLCADDMLELSAIRESIDAFETRRNARFIYGDATFIDIDGRRRWAKREIPFSWYIWLYTSNFITQPAAFWHRSLYHDVGGLDRRFHLAMDGDLFARFAQLTRPLHVRREWAKVRWYSAQKTQRLEAKGDAETKAIRARYGYDESSPWTVMHCLTAKVLRICLKATLGCYSISDWQGYLEYIQRFRPLEFGRGRNK